jgi:hypothetical protein
MNGKGFGLSLIKPNVTGWDWNGRRRHQTKQLLSGSRLDSETFRMLQINGYPNDYGFQRERERERERERDRQTDRQTDVFFLKTLSIASVKSHQW